MNNSITVNNQNYTAYYHKYVKSSNDEIIGRYRLKLHSPEIHSNFNYKILVIVEPKKTAKEKLKMIHNWNVSFSLESINKKYITAVIKPFDSNSSLYFGRIFRTDHLILFLLYSNYLEIIILDESNYESTREAILNNLAVGELENQLEELRENAIGVNLGRRLGNLKQNERGEK